MNLSIKKCLHLLGGLLGISGIFFVIERLIKYSDQINLNQFTSRDWILLILLTYILGAANLLLAMAWQQLLSFLGIRVNSFWSIRTYGVSLLAKYVPGNVFQFAGRQAIGMSVGISGRELLKSTLYELGMLAAAGATFWVLILPLLWSNAPQLAALIFFASLIFGIGLYLKRYWSPNLAMAWWFHSLFLVVSGLGFWGALWIASPQLEPPLPIPAIVGAYVLAWLAGLVTPGAPAGIGVREALLLLLLGELIAPDSLLLAVIVGRAITIAGDLIFSITSSQLRTSPN